VAIGAENTPGPVNFLQQQFASNETLADRKRKAAAPFGTAALVDYATGD
jgi:hypothetical protein